MNKIKVTKTEALFFFLYLIYLSSKMFVSVSFLTDIMKYFRLVVYIMFCVLILAQIKHYKLKDLFFMIAIFGFLLISAYNCKDENLIILFLFILNFSKINFKRFVKYDFIIRLVFLLSVIILYYLGLTTNYTMFREDGQIRQSMGFSHPNVFGMYVFTIIVDLFYLNFGKKKFLPFIISIVSIFLVSYLSDSRTSIICMVLLSLFLFLDLFVSENKKNKIMDKKFINISKFILPISTLITYIFVLIYRTKSEFAISLNMMLSGRLSGINNILASVNINLFGNFINFVSTQEAKLLSIQHLCLDNSYFYLLIVYGIVPFIIFSYFICKLIKRVINKKDLSMFLILLVYIIYGFMESNLLVVGCNIFILPIAYELFLNGKKEKEI